jgi:HEPN domain-containing protein
MEITLRPEWRIRAELLLQAYWSSQQALEKYLKGILLFRRIPRKKPTHSLKALLEELEAKFPIGLSKGTREFIDFIENWDVDRYFIYPFGSEGLAARV